MSRLMLVVLRAMFWLSVPCRPEAVFFADRQVEHHVLPYANPCYITAGLSKGDDEDNGHRTSQMIDDLGVVPSAMSTDIASWITEASCCHRGN